MYSIHPPPPPLPILKQNPSGGESVLYTPRPSLQPQFFRFVSSPSHLRRHLGVITSRTTNKWRQPNKTRSVNTERIQRGKNGNWCTCGGGGGGGREGGVRGEGLRTEEPSWYNTSVKPARKMYSQSQWPVACSFIEVMCVSKIFKVQFSFRRDV